MNTSEIVKARIQMAVLSASIQSMLFMKGQLTSKELDQKIEDIQDDLYEFISQSESTNEVEVL